MLAAGITFLPRRHINALAVSTPTIKYSRPRQTSGALPMWITLEWHHYP